MINNSFETLQESRIQQRISGLKDAQDEATQLLLIKRLFVEIQKSSKSIVDEIEGGVAISNLDEVTTALHNETNRNAKLFVSALKDLKLSTERQAVILKEIMTDSQSRLDEEFQTIKIRRPLDKVHVLNPEDFPVSEEVDVKNWPDLAAMFTSLEKAMRESLNINLPAPQVNVEAPNVNVAAPSISVPPVEFDEVIATLERNLKMLRINKKTSPLFVQLSDERFLEKLDEIREASKNVMLGFPGAVRIQNANGGMVDFNQIGTSVPTVAGSGKTTVTTAGTRVVLASSKNIKSVTIKALSTNTGFIYVGDTTVSSSNGFQLSAKDSISMDISNLTTVNIDSSVNGEGVSYMWVN